jgi:hypothetical protein
MPEQLFLVLSNPGQVSVILVFAFYVHITHTQSKGMQYARVPDLL